MRKKYLANHGKSGIPLAMHRTIVVVLLLTASADAQVVLDQPPTRNFWIDIHPAAVVHRMNDRVLIGGATVNDGKLFNTRKDWLETLRPFTTNNAQFAAFNTIGQIAILGASRTSDFGSATSGTIGISGWGINDNTAKLSTAYGGYFESFRLPGTWFTHGVEININNFGNTGRHTPYAMFPSGLTPALWLASGGNHSGVQTASLALGIIDNGARFDKGIVFRATALDGTDGTGTGSAVAIEMARGHQIRWVQSDGTTRAQVDSERLDITEVRLIGPGGGGTLYVSNGKLFFRNDQGVVSQITL